MSVGDGGGGRNKSSHEHCVPMCAIYYAPLLRPVESLIFKGWISLLPLDVTLMTHTRIDINITMINLPDKKLIKAGNSIPAQLTLQQRS